MDNSNSNWKKNITLFMISQAVSVFGSMLVQYAITWHITLKTQSGLMMTISILCGFLPTFILSPFAGVWADRYNRKTLIILADSLIALATLILAILFMMGYDAIWLLFVASAIRALGSGIQTPAIGAFIPQIVPEDKLTKVNATNGSIHSLIMLISPMISGALLSVATIEAIFFIDIITAAVAVSILLLFLRVPAHEKALNRESSGYFSDMRQGYNYIRNHDYIKTFFFIMAIFYLLISPAAFLTPLQVTRTFGDNVWRLTAIEMAFSIGMMAGGLVMASWGGFKNKLHTMVLSVLAIGVCTFALGIIPVFWIYLFFMLLTGASIPFFNTPATVLFQQKVEGEYLGRVFGVLGMIQSAMMPLGMLIFGPVADLIEIEWLLIGTGLLIFIESIFMMGNKILIEAGKPAENTNEEADEA